MNNANSSFVVPSSTFTCSFPASSSIPVSHVSASTYGYTRATWRHLMGDKSNAFDLIKAFLAMVQTQFNTEVQAIRSDNALELGSSPSASSFYSEHDIIHQTSIPYTLQQNGERLKPRAAPCIFLGYPFAKKGYKLYNLTTKKCLISRDVIFHEHYFPFSQSHPTTTSIPSPCIPGSTPSTVYPESSNSASSPSSSSFSDTAAPLSLTSSSPHSILVAPSSSPTSHSIVTLYFCPTSPSSSVAPALISSTPSSSIPSQGFRDIKRFRGLGFEKEKKSERKVKSDLHSFQSNSVMLAHIGFDLLGSLYVEL
uniref:Uncharacterized serine-rich protein C215.13-like n=1 Tax=Nicotiana tabacum TaxID=4097 RepID=A0A1S3X8G1_TOBAC